MSAPSELLCCFSLSIFVLASPTPFPLLFFLLQHTVLTGQQLILQLLVIIWKHFLLLSISLWTTHIFCSSARHAPGSGLPPTAPSSPAHYGRGEPQHPSLHDSISVFSQPSTFKLTGTKHILLWYLISFALSAPPTPPSAGNHIGRV